MFDENRFEKADVGKVAFEDDIVTPVPVPKFNVSTLTYPKYPLEEYMFEDLEVGKLAFEDEIVTPVPSPKFNTLTLI